MKKSVIEELTTKINIYGDWLYSRSSRKRTPSVRDKNVRNWSWHENGSRKRPLEEYLRVGDRWPLTGACPANNKYWYTKKYRGIKQTLKYGTVISAKSL